MSDFYGCVYKIHFFFMPTSLQYLHLKGFHTHTEARLCHCVPLPPASQLQEPPCEPSGLPREHEAAAHHGGFSLEHQADCFLGSGRAVPPCGLSP